MDKEQELHARISSGRLRDSDINDILNHGDKRLKDHLERRANELYGQKKDLDRKYGDGAFDGVDNAGRPFKDLDVGDTFTTNR